MHAEPGTEIEVIGSTRQASSSSGKPFSTNTIRLSADSNRKWPEVWVRASVLPDRPQTMPNPTVDRSATLSGAISYKSPPDAFASRSSEPRMVVEARMACRASRILAWRA